MLRIRRYNPPMYNAAPTQIAQPRTQHVATPGFRARVIFELYSAVGQELDGVGGASVSCDASSGVA